MDQGRAGSSHAEDMIRTLGDKLKREIQSTPWRNVRNRAPSISKVNALARNVAPAEYEPQYVFIGPYHRGSSPLAAEKIAFLDTILRVGRKSVEDYLRAMEMLEEEARSCYANKFEDMTKEEFVRMLLLDGCFILGRFVDLTAFPTAVQAPTQGAASGNMLPPSSSGQRRVSDKVENKDIVRDVFYLVENQIPFFVIEKIHELTFSTSVNISAVARIEEYLKRLLLGHPYMAAMAERMEEPSHLLHLLHMHFMPADQPVQPITNDKRARVGRWHSATEYHKAGVKFKKRELSAAKARCILDVRLHEGVLEVPCLEVDNETWRILRNLMALEQRNHRAIGSYVMAYCFFMWQIACTAEDVALLSSKGIINHSHPNNAEAARAISGLCKGIVFDVNDPDENYLWHAWQALDQRYKSRPRNWWAELQQKYFNSPWAVIGLLSLAVQLTCSVVQAVYSVFSVRKG